VRGELARTSACVCEEWKDVGEDNLGWFCSLLLWHALVVVDCKTQLNGVGVDTLYASVCVCVCV
jgi:hypothetical protein